MSNYEKSLTDKQEAEKIESQKNQKIPLKHDESSLIYGTWSNLDYIFVFRNDALLEVKKLSQYLGDTKITSGIHEFEVPSKQKLTIFLKNSHILHFNIVLNTDKDLRIQSWSIQGELLHEVNLKRS